MMSPGMQKLKSHFMNTETPSMGGMKKKIQFFGVCFLLLGLGFLWGSIFSLETKKWRFLLQS